jgi:hypothetical protein
MKESSLPQVTDTNFIAYYRGYFRGVLRWPQLDALWQQVRAQPEGWYVYLIGHDLPHAPVNAETLLNFIEEVDKLLRHEHAHDYCGIVYTDDWERPQMIKIFDPHNLGASCGSVGHEIFPRWLLSRIPPVPLQDLMPIPASRTRWWHTLFR